MGFPVLVKWHLYIESAPRFGPFGCLSPRAWILHKWQTGERSALFRAIPHTCRIFSTGDFLEDISSHTLKHVWVKKTSFAKLDELYPFWSENIKLNFWCVYLYSHETIHRYNWGTIFCLFLREIPGKFHVFTHQKVDFTAAENAREMNILNNKNLAQTIYNYRWMIQRTAWALQKELGIIYVSIPLITNSMEIWVSHDPGCNWMISQLNCILV